MKVLTLIWLVVTAAIPDSMAAARWSEFAQKPDSWYRSAAGWQIVSNVLSHQSLQGSWPKNVDTTAKRFEGKREKLQGTFDNGATTDELRFLMRACLVTRESDCESAFRKG